MEEVFRKKFGKVFVVLDTCHSGILQFTYSKYADQLYCMVAAESKYTHGNFSDVLLDAFSRREGDVADHLVDTKKGAVTFSKIFSYAHSKVKTSAADEKPISFGSLGGEPVRSKSVDIPDAFRRNTPPRTVYKRIYHLLSILTKGKTNLEGIMEEVRKMDVFLVSSDDEGKNYVSTRRIREFLNYLVAIDFVDKLGLQYVINENGRKASGEFDYNSMIVQSTIEKLFPDGVDIGELNEIVFAVLENGDPPNALNVSEEIRRRGLGRVSDSDNFRLAFLILSFTGVFKRGTTDEIYPL